jgi:hypothetical protein
MESICSINDGGALVAANSSSGQMAGITPTTGTIPWSHKSEGINSQWETIYVAENWDGREWDRIEISWRKSKALLRTKNHSSNYYFVKRKYCLYSVPIPMTLDCIKLHLIWIERNKLRHWNFGRTSGPHAVTDIRVILTTQSEHISFAYLVMLPMCSQKTVLYMPTSARTLSL